MYSDDRQLLKKLVVIISVKVVAVYGLWSLFIKDYRVPLDHQQQVLNHFFKADVKTADKTEKRQQSSTE